MSRLSTNGWLSVTPRGDCCPLDSCPCFRGNLSWARAWPHWAQQKTLPQLGCWSWPRITNLLFFSPFCSSLFQGCTLSVPNNIAAWVHVRPFSHHAAVPGWEVLFSASLNCFLMELFCLIVFLFCVTFPEQSAPASVQVYQPMAIRRGAHTSQLHFLHFVAMCLCACLDSHALPEHTTSMRAASGQGMVALTLGIGPLLVLIFGILTYISISLSFFFFSSNGPISKILFKTGLFGLSL